MSKFWEMKNKKYYSLVLAVLLFSLLSQNMYHNASALTQRDFSVYNNNHVTASYGVSKVCGLSIHKMGYVACNLGKVVITFPKSDWTTIQCSSYNQGVSPNLTYLDKNHNMWYHYCGKYNDFQTHSDVTVQQEQSMQKLVVSRAFFLIINNQYLPDSALVQPSINSRGTLALWLKVLWDDIGEHHYNFAIRDAANYSNLVNTLVTDPHYQPKVKSLFNDIQLMATNEARP